jgi:hypothetical protein
MARRVAEARSLARRFRVTLRHTFSLAALALIAFSPARSRAQQAPDTLFDTRIARPAFTTRHPRVAIDEAHHNFHRLDGRYRPFADLMRHDGCEVAANRARFNAASLKGIDVMVISNALGHDDMSAPAAASPAFTNTECAALHAWVRAGGALLLIADHAPMGSAARALGDTLGVDMRSACTLDPVLGDADNPTLITYRAGHGLEADNAIMRGRDSTESVHTVVAFTGQSLQGPPAATVLLKLSDKAMDFMVGLADMDAEVPMEKRRAAMGRCQGLAMKLGKGRVVVLGEAAMMTAQVAGPDRFPMGMNVPGNDDRQFAINIVRWLAGALE